MNVNKYMNGEITTIHFNDSERGEEDDEKEVELNFGKIALYGLISAYVLPIIIINNIVTNFVIIFGVKYEGNSKSSCNRPLGVMKILYCYHYFST